MIRCARWRTIGLVVGWATAGSVGAFVVEYDDAGVIRKWALNPVDFRVPVTSVNRSTKAIVYRMDSGGSGRGNAAAELNAVRSAFDQWQSVAGTVLKFEEGAPLSGTQDIHGSDGINSAFWTKSTFVNGGKDNISGATGVTYVSSYVDGNVITDADIVFNAADYSWFTDVADPTTLGVFTESVALHEIGHLAGLFHSPVGGATMFYTSDRGVGSLRGLSADETMAMRGLYGTAATLNASGRVTGTVSLGVDPVGGAAVFLQDAAGNQLSGTVTRTNGTYELAGVPPGSYVVRVAPLDPGSAPNYLARGGDIWTTFRSALTQFHPSLDRAVAVLAKGSVTVNFVVTNGTPVRVVRLLRPAPDLTSPSFNNKPVSVPRGGPARYVGVLTTSPLSGDEQLSVTGDGLTLGPVERKANALPGLSLVAAPLLVAAHATPGLRNLRLQRVDRVAWVHGYLEIEAPQPDANFDGLDDGFQRRYWPRWTIPAGAPSADPDGDGFDNRWEAAAGSDPTNRLSANFSIESVRVTAQGARVRSQAAKGRKFQLLTRDTVPGADWRNVGAAVTASTNVLEFLDAMATNRVQYYRVQLVP